MKKTDQSNPSMAPVEEVLKRLKKPYGDRTIALKFSNPFELLVATILSAQANDQTVNRVTERLFQKYRTPEDYLRVPLEELENDIRAINFYRNKAKAIRNCCQSLVEKFGGQVPDTMEALTQLSGVGRKTANVVLSFAFCKNEGVVVDTHVARVAQRLGWTQEKQADRIEQDLMNLIPQKQWADASNWLIWHGRERCTARNPDCEHCEVRDLCPSAGQISNSKKPSTRRKRGKSG